jgi:hypothetical protein
MRERERERERKRERERWRERERESRSLIAHGTHQLTNCRTVLDLLPDPDGTRPVLAARRLCVCMRACVCGRCAGGGGGGKGCMQCMCVCMCACVCVCVCVCECVLWIGGIGTWDEVMWGEEMGGAL